MKAVLIVLLFFTYFTGYGQSKKQPIYRTQVTTHNGMQLVGVLTSLNDSSIQLVPLAQFSNRQLVGQPELHTYRVQDIYLLRIRKMGAPGRTALQMGLGSAIVGGLIGNISYRPCASTSGWFGCFQIFDRSGMIAVGAITGATFGTGIGFLVGTGNSKYYLRGDFETYRQMRSTLMQYIYPIQLTAQTP